MKHWVFDLDGTLVDSFSHFFASLERIFNDHGARFTPDLRMAALTESLPLFFTRHLGEKALEPAFEKLKILSNEDALSIRPFAGVETFLAHLKKQGSKVGIWTNRDYESASLIVQHSGLAPYVDEFVSGTCTTLRKPHPEGLLRIIEKFQSHPSEITMVGDHEHDVTAAKAAGSRGVRASWHAYWSVEPCVHTEHHFHHFSEFTNWARS
jgi:HAD superfamily hydrolase (TIGR01549 family)